MPTKFSSGSNLAGDGKRATALKGPKVQAGMLFQILFGVETQFDEAFEEFVGGDAKEVSQDEFFCVEPADVAQFKGFVAGGINEIAMAAVDDDDVFVCVEA